MTAGTNSADLPAGPSLSAAETTFRWMARPYAFLDECVAEHGDRFTLNFSRFGTHVVVSRPADVRAVLSADRDTLWAGRANALLEPVLGRHSLLVVDGERHQRQRALLQPAFRSERVAGYASVVGEAVRRHTAEWKDGDTVSLQAAALEISKEVILRAVFGVEADEVERFSRLIHRLMTLVATNATFDDDGANPRLQERFREARESLANAIQEHVERRRRAPRADDVLSRLIGAQGRNADGRLGGLTAEAIRDQMITMILAGHETTASSITWALLCLHSQPDVLRELYAELDAAGLGAAEERLAALPYLNAVCLETLRVRPVIPVISRLVRRPFQLDGLALPEGVFVTPSPYLAHRRAESFPDPDEFRPRRFLEKRFSPYVYFPFGGGVRRCIGMDFALLELGIALGRLLQWFRFEPCDPAPARGVRRAVTVVAAGGGKMRVVRRSDCAGCGN